MDSNKNDFFLIARKGGWVTHAQIFGSLYTM